MSDAVLETRKLGKFFGRFAANEDIDFSVAPGELRAVIGPNGAGKTTFFNMLSGTTDATHGSIVFRGHDITRVSGTRRVHLGIAKAFQTANLYAEQSVLQNCRLAALARTQGTFALELTRCSKRLPAVDEIAERAIDQLDLGNVADVRSGDLAHGDKKRLDIAIALATEPEILLLDEPVAGMSRDDARKTGTLVRKLADRITVLIIEHDMDMIMGISDSITVLETGRVLATGTPAEIRANQQVQAAYLGGHSEAEIGA
jgi:branched-chain amino acid transport system ATP-binding protein